MSRSDQDGFVVILALMAMTLMGALVTALVLGTSLEIAIAVNFRNAGEARYAADAGIERAMADLPAADWNAILDGSTRSTFADGPPGGTRVLVDGTVLDLGQILNDANCEQPTACSTADMDAVTPQRPWGANNPRWRPFAYGRIADLLPGSAVNSPFYVLVLAADDPSENDGDPSKDGRTATNPGSGVLMLRSAAFGPRGVRQQVEATVARTGDPSAPAGARLLSWRTVP